MSPSPTTKTTPDIAPGSASAAPAAPDASGNHEPAAPEPALRRLPKSLGVLRIALGLVLTWAFLDKLFGFGLNTPSNRSLLSGASATRGYLSSREGWFSGAFQAVSGTWWIDALFVLGLAGGGIALVLGLASRLATVAVLGVFGGIYLSQLPLANNPFIDQHLFYCITAVALLSTGADRVLGLEAWWRSLPLVRKQPLLW